MQAENLPILYVKSGCPWCHEVIEFMDSNGVSYREVNVSESDAAMKEMQKKSGQTKAPTLDWHGRTLLGDICARRQHLPNCLGCTMKRRTNTTHSTSLASAYCTGCFLWRKGAPVDHVLC
ncbi:MAG: glutaredoxin family protein [Cytophagaceae bacterium]|nr:MAG: glutaredoxin family protein [Cytophagaceae bacterium]